MTMAEVISLESNQLKFILFCFKSYPDVREMIGLKKKNWNKHKLEIILMSLNGMCAASAMAEWLKKHTVEEIENKETKKNSLHNGLKLFASFLNASVVSGSKLYIMPKAKKQKTKWYLNMLTVSIILLKITTMLLISMSIIRLSDNDSSLINY